MPAGDGAAEDIGTAPADGVTDPDAEQALAGRVEPDDPAIAIDLEDDVGRPVDDGRQLAAFALEGLANRALRNATTSSCRASWTTRIPSESGARDRRQSHNPKQDRGRVVGHHGPPAG